VAVSRLHGWRKLTIPSDQASEFGTLLWIIEMISSFATASYSETDDEQMGTRQQMLVRLFNTFNASYLHTFGCGAIVIV
jgi:hypothetical protein